MTRGAHRPRLGHSRGRPAVLAHRGGRGPWRENTLEAFSGGLALGADGVELDVRRAADGTLVVHHDPVVREVGPVHELHADQLPPWVPTLGRALEVCAGAVVNVEIKHAPGERWFAPDEAADPDKAADPDEAADPAGPEEATVAEVARALEGVTRGTSSRSRAQVPAQVIVSSFSVRTLAAASHAGIGALALLALLVPPGFDALDALEQAASLGCTGLHPFYDQVTSQLVTRAHDAGMAVVAWTVNEPARLTAVVDAGVDGVITDDVAGTLRALGRERRDGRASHGAC